METPQAPQTKAQASQVPSRGPVESFFSRLTAKPLFWIVVVGSLAGFQLVRAMTRELPEPPKPLLDLPEFSLIDQRGQPFGSKDLEGKFWVANFIFTSCPTMCPMLTKQMQLVRHRLKNMGDAVHLVSFSVDPERDTPEKLRAYAEQYGANAKQWTFLTGELRDIEKTIVEGFKMPIDKQEPEPGADRNLFDITHGSRFVLVDNHNRIRGFYEASDEGISQLVKDMGLVAAHEMIKGKQGVAKAN